jgi:hypothetical protein
MWREQVGSAKLVILTFLPVLFGVSYFTLTEGLWGRSLGKWLCGLRVTTTSNTTPTVRQILVRSLTFTQSWLSVCPDGTVSPLEGSGHATSFETAFLIAMVAMCATMRRSNGSQDCRKS